MKLPKLQHVCKWSDAVKVRRTKHSPKRLRCKVCKDEIPNSHMITGRGRG